MTEKQTHNEGSLNAETLLADMERWAGDKSLPLPARKKIALGLVEALEALRDPMLSGVERGLAVGIEWGRARMRWWLSYGCWSEQEVLNQPMEQSTVAPPIDSQQEGVNETPAEGNQ